MWYFSINNRTPESSYEESGFATAAEAKAAAEAFALNHYGLDYKLYLFVSQDREGAEEFTRAWPNPGWD